MAPLSAPFLFDDKAFSQNLVRLHQKAEVALQYN
ncbi:Uncharacterised protein [Shewanella putrefaciens]|nr:Uncharacterised protein [Shewanella putrefaciens]